MSLQIILKNSSVSGKEPTASQLANGELALNYHADGPFISCKDTDGTVRRIAGVWIGTSSPSSPTPGEFWLDTNTDPAKLKVYKDATDTWIDTITVNAASTTTAGIVELATNAETQTGTDTLRAVTPASLQSKVSDSTTTTSSTTIASSTAVKSAKDVADAALPAAGGTISGDLIISGDLTVNGTTTTIDTETLVVKDKNIELGVVDTPTDVTADGGGITLKGTTDKTLNWVDSTDSWTSSENVDLASGKTYKINGTDVLSGTTLGAGVTGSSLTSVGTITSGTWNGTQIATDYIADDAVTSAKIADGTIVDANVNASAAIAGTKIDADFGAQDLTVDTDTLYVDATNDSVGIGTNSPETALPLTVDAGTALSTSAVFKSSDTGGGSYIAFVDKDTSTNFRVRVGAVNDDLEFLTGGSPSARIDGSGRLLVGGSSSISLNGIGAPLQIQGTSSSTSSASFYRFQDNTNGPFLYFAKSRGANVGDSGVVSDGDLLGEIRFNGDDGTDLDNIGASIEALVDGTPDTGVMPGELRFSTNDGTLDANPITRMIVRANGNIGIATNVPVAGFQVKNSSATGFSVADNADFSGVGIFIESSTDSDDGNYGAALAWSKPGNSSVFKTAIAPVQEGSDPDVQGLAFFTASGVATDDDPEERVRISNSGQVGIGTTPDVALHVATTGTPQFRLEDLDTANAYSNVSASNGNFVIQADPQNVSGSTRIGFEIDGSEVARIDSSGNVGINNNNPAAKLTVRGDTDSLTAQFIQNDDTVDERIVLAQSTGGQNLGAYVDSSNVRHLTAGQDDVLTSNNSFLSLYSNGGTEGARLTSGGAFIVGGSSQNNSNTVLQAEIASGTIDTFVQSGELADGNWARARARGRISGGAYREAWIGAYKHSGITDAVAFLRLDQEDNNSSYIWADNSNVLRISQTVSNLGTTNGTVVGEQTSDERLKNVGEAVPYGLNEVLQLQPKQYALKTEPDTNKLGFIAQEVESLIPEAVFDTHEELEGHQEGDRTKLGMSYVQLIPVLVNAIKEQQATISDLQTRLAALEGN